MRRTFPALVFVLLPLVASCADNAADGPAGVALTGLFGEAAVSNTPDLEPPSPISLAFGEADVEEGTHPTDAEVLHDIAGLQVADGRISGRTTGERSALHVAVPEDVELEDVLHAVEVRIQVSAGSELSLAFSGGPELPEDFVQEQIVDNPDGFPIVSPIVPGDEARTYTLDTSQTMMGALPLSALRQLVIRPTDVADAEFTIESIRIVSRREYLLGVPSGVSWQGLAEIYRETLVTRTPERVDIEVELPSRPYLDLALGMIEPGVATFRVSLAEGEDETELVRRTLTTADRWEPFTVELSEWAGRTVTLRLQGSAENDGTLLYWGAPAIRQQRDTTVAARASEARAALGETERPPHGVLFILADTLRRDRLPWYGGPRDNAPNLARIAEQGSVFTRNVSQGTWTKVSVPSILTSLYPSTHGIYDIPHRLPSSVTTLAEGLREAGYSTYATSSVPFTGKLTNLHQGIEVLHEAGSVNDLPHSSAKTARTYVDRLLPWLDEHAEQPFFVFLHVFDPHSPLRPYAPWDTLYTDPGENEEQEARAEAVQEHIEDDHMRGDVMPTREELAAAEVDAEAFVDTELDWYDGSIRGMDAEIGRVLERLETLGVADDTLIVFMSDHGEEFLEHGRHFHGWNAYGEMINVPLMFWWPGVVPALRSDEVVQSIDVMPTVLDLARVPVPEQAQGQSLLPLLASPESPSRLGWTPRPAFAERRPSDTFSTIGEENEVESWVIVADGWKLIRNGRRPESWPEFELYDYVNDPLDQSDVAADNPEVVEQLAAELDAWLEQALAAKIEEASTDDMSPDELARLRSLGYIQ